MAGAVVCCGWGAHVGWKGGVNIETVVILLVVVVMHNVALGIELRRWQLVVGLGPSAIRDP